MRRLGPVAGNAQPGVVPDAQRQQRHRGQDADAHQRRRSRPPSHPLQRPLQAADRPRPDRLAVEEAAQIVGQLAGRRVALFRIFLETLQADGFEVARHGASAGLTGRFGLLRRGQRERFHDGASAEGRHAGQGFIEEGAQRVDVGMGADVAQLSQRLFRGHVPRRAEYRAGVRLALGLNALGEAEVGDLGRAVGERGV